MAKKLTFKKQFELEKQLHEQYAMNNNERMSSLITLFVSLIAVLGAYGYMFLHTSSQSASDLGCIYLENEKYTIDALLLTASMCFVIIAIIQHLCIYQGAYQRKEQFIIYAIRQKYKIDDDLFPSGYTPFGKTRRDFVQGIYGELVKIFGFVKVAILMTTLWKYFEAKIDINSITYECVVSFGICCCLSILYVNVFYSVIYSKYKRLENEQEK